MWQPSWLKYVLQLIMKDNYVVFFTSWFPKIHSFGYIKIRYFILKMHPLEVAKQVLPSFQHQRQVAQRICLTNWKSHDQKPVYHDRSLNPGALSPGPLPCSQSSSLSLLSTQNTYSSKPQKSSITIPFMERIRKKLEEWRLPIETLKSLAWNFCG